MTVRACCAAAACLMGEGITYLPVAEIIRQAAGIDETQTEEQARQRIDELVAGMQESAAVARGLAGLVGLDASAAKKSSFGHSAGCLEHLADTTPLVVLVDDIHWAEPTLLDLIESVADLTRDSPILFVCTARPEFLDGRPTWGGGRLNATTILLEPLSEGSALDVDRCAGAWRCTAGRRSRANRRGRRGQPALRRGVRWHAHR